MLHTPYPPLCMATYHMGVLKFRRTDQVITEPASALHVMN